MCYLPCNTTNIDIYTQDNTLTQPVTSVTQGQKVTFYGASTVFKVTVVPYSPVCKILDTAHLQALSPSPWGNDGALDNLPVNCTSITDPTCHLPSSVVTLLQTTTRLAAEAIR